jgi:hypothetical protein
MSDMAKKALRQDRETRNIGTLQRILDQLASCHPSIRKWLLAEGYLPAEAVSGWAVAERDSALRMVLRELDLLGRARRFSAMTAEEVEALNAQYAILLSLALLPHVAKPGVRLLLEYRLEFDLDTWVRIRWGDWEDGVELDGRSQRMIWVWNQEARARRTESDGRRTPERRDPADWWKSE